MGGPEKQIKDTILVVDDTPDNLALLNEMLKGHYRIKLATNGEQALELIMTDKPPDLILLDIMMPVMDGYQVCAKIKSTPSLKDIPVIFISALADTTDIIKGFQVGGVDYVTKPFQFEEVFARVKVQIEFRRSKVELQSLLSKTLTGSIKVMLDVLGMTHPALVEQSNRLRRYAKEMTKQLSINSNEAWILDLAIMLFKLGCLAVPATILEKKMAGFALTEGELEQYNSYPAVSAEIVGRIPRLEKVAEIISNQMIGFEEISGAEDDVVFLGSLMLTMLLEYDQTMSAKKASQVAAELVVSRMPSSCPAALIHAFMTMATGNVTKKEWTIHISELKPGMVLVEDILTMDGKVLLSKGNEISDSLLTFMTHVFKTRIRAKDTAVVYI